MTDLREALENLEYWLWHNYPSVCDSLSPGLTDEQIQEECKNLSFDIPEEIRDFYRWRNGARNIFYSTHMREGVIVFSLNKAVDLTIDLKGGGYVADLVNSKQIDNAFFMFGEFERWLHFVECRNRNTSPVLILSDDDCIRLTHTSLTSMVLTTLECYEEEILTFNEFGCVHLNDMEDYRAIFMKNNTYQDDIRQQYGNAIDIYLEFSSSETNQ